MNDFRMPFTVFDAVTVYVPATSGAVQVTVEPVLELRLPPFGATQLTEVLTPSRTAVRDWKLPVAMETEAGVTVKELSFTVRETELLVAVPAAFETVTAKVAPLSPLAVVKL